MQRVRVFNPVAERRSEVAAAMATSIKCVHLSARKGALKRMLYL